MGKRDQRRRREVSDHVQRNLIDPMVLAAELRERGVPVEDVIVNLSPDAEGFTVTCDGCGRTAKLAQDPGVKVGLCPDCIRKARGQS